MTTPTPRARIALAAAMVAAIGGATFATAVVMDRDDSPVSVASSAMVQDGTDDVEEPAEAAPEGVAEADGDREERGDADAADAESAPAGTEPAPMAISDTSTPIECVGEDWQPSEEELAAQNEESQALAAVLDAAGIEHTVTTDSYGFISVQYDYSDGIAQAVTNSFYRDRYPDEYIVEPIPEEELERIREENAGLIAAFEAAGIAYEVIADEGGWEWVDYDYEDPAAQEVADAYYSELYPAEPIPEEELERIREENAGLIAAFDEAGIAYEVMSDESGWEWVEWDYEDPAANAIADEFYRDIYPVEELPAEELEYIRAENEQLIAALDEAGIAYEVITEEGGYEWVEWDYEDPEAQAVVDEFYGNFGEECWGGGDIDWEPTPEDLERSNAEADALIAAFDAAGVDYTVQEDDYGFRWVDFDYDDPGAQEAAESVWQAQSAEMAAAVSADLDRLAAAFDTAGIAYEREGHDECETIIFDVNDPAALAAVAAA